MPVPREGPLEARLDAVTLPTEDMAGAVAFYRKLGFELTFQDGHGRFTCLRAGTAKVNLVAATIPSRWKGRIILHVPDVDGLYERFVRAGVGPGEPPRDAAWGERYFHLVDPDGHGLSFARPLP